MWGVVRQLSLTEPRAPRGERLLAAPAAMTRDLEPLERGALRMRV